MQTSGQQTFLNKELVYPGDEVEAEIAIVSVDFFQNQLKEGMDFEFREGHAIITGTFNEMQHTLNKLDFEMNTDQTFLAETLSSLTMIYEKFGDNKGVLVK